MTKTPFICWRAARHALAGPLGEPHRGSSSLGLAARSSPASAEEDTVAARIQNVRLPHAAPSATTVCSTVPRTERSTTRLVGILSGERNGRVMLQRLRRPD